MNFPYFADYERFAAFLEEEAACDCCGEITPCLDATLFYGEETMAAICPACLSQGKLLDRDLFTCEGDLEELTNQIQARYPEWTPAAVEAAVGGKTMVLEKMTPPIVRWQDWPWPCADGDYCRFLGYGSKSLYQKFAQGHSAAEVFENSLYHTVQNEAEELWATYLPDREISSLADSQTYATLFYVFQSRENGRLVTVWDAA